MGLGDPSVTAKLHIRTEKNRTESESGTKSDEPTSYQDWIKQAQVSRNSSWKFNVALHESKDTANPPHFDKVQKYYWYSILGVDAMPLSLKNLLLKNMYIFR